VNYAPDQNLCVFISGFAVCLVNLSVLEKRFTGSSTYSLNRHKIATRELARESQ
jgi:Ni/Fe-hydrogenase subunit HybB-like protein